MFFILNNVRFYVNSILVTYNNTVYTCVKYINFIIALIINAHFFNYCREAHEKYQ